VHIGRQSRQCLRDSYTAGVVSLSKKYASAVTLSALVRVEVTLKESAMIFEYSLAALMIGELLLIYALLRPGRTGFGTR
jgi:hypothetical protein